MSDSVSIDDFDVVDSVPVQLRDKVVPVEMRSSDVTPFVMVAAKDDLEKDDLDRVTEAMTEMFKRTLLGEDPSRSDERKVEKLVMEHYMDIFKQVLTGLQWVDDEAVSDLT